MKPVFGHCRVHRVGTSLAHIEPQHLRAIMMWADRGLPPHNLHAAMEPTGSRLFLPLGNASSGSLVRRR